jgi:hypothetical protein
MPAPEPTSRGRDRPGRQERLLELEGMILSVLCASCDPAGLRGQLSATLAGYSWRRMDHRVVYDALARTSSRDPRPLREQVAAAATRMGFPDIDWTHYFPAGATSTAGSRAGSALPDLILELLALETGG